MKSATSPRRAKGETAPLPTIRRPALHAQVVDKLRRLIANGDLPAGEKLNEVQIAASFRVSRTPIREAVKLLASEGLLELLPGRGARVRQLTPDETREHFDMIGALERHAVELATAHMTEPRRQDLLALHARLKAAFEAADARAYFEVNQKMHRFFVQAAGNASLAALHDTLTKRTRRERPMTLASAPRWSASMAEHDRIIEAALAGHGEAAGRAMLAHLRATGEAMASVTGDPE